MVQGPLERRDILAEYSGLIREMKGMQSAYRSLDDRYKKRTADLENLQAAHASLLARGHRSPSKGYVGHQPPVEKKEAGAIRRHASCWC